MNRSSLTSGEVNDYQTKQRLSHAALNLFVKQDSSVIRKASEFTVSSWFAGGIKLLFRKLNSILSEQNRREADTGFKVGLVRCSKIRSGQTGSPPRLLYSCGMAVNRDTGD
jgi:hypothetical protein